MSRDYKPTSSKGKSTSKGSPFFAGLLVGLLLGVGISVAVAIFIKGGDSPFVDKRPPVDSLEIPDATSKDSRKNAADATPTAEKPRFDFYTILPGSESPVSDKEIQQQKDQPADTKGNENYYLQVGAFQAESEADNMKAKLALLGMEAVIQTATIPDKGVWHRVRVGPFLDLNQIDKARGDLTKNGFSADLIKIRNGSADQ